MRQHWFRLILAVSIFVLTATGAQAVSLGKIEVASKLGEPFYAEVPLNLDSGEKIGAVDVNIAAASEYRILEVYFDPALKAIRAEVESDKRGNRVKLTSTAGIDSPFFNLVLRVRYDRATHFKKYPVFLDLPKAMRAPAAHQAAPAAVKPEPVAKSAPVATAGESHAFKPYDGWARTGRYGPMVYGDTISTVADRLRIDERYTKPQVMVALFEKNRSKFSQNNINLINAGSFLKVPTAAEVEQHSPEQALEVLREQERRWHELTKQTKYADVAEAQRTRYSKRVSVGSASGGEASAPMPQAEQAAALPAAPVAKASAPTAAAAPAAATAAGAEPASADLARENEQLKTKLAESEQAVAALNAKLAAGSETTQQAVQQRMKKLELRLARMQSELDNAREQLAAAESRGPDWLTIGLGILVVLLLAVVGFLLRRERQHPAATSQPQPAVEPETATAPVEDEVPLAAAPAAAAMPEPQPAASAGQPETETKPETESQPEAEPAGLQPQEAGKPAATDGYADLLSKADVYMRYGMEDEAIQQLKQAVEQKPHLADAHIRLARISHGMGDASAVEATTADAHEMLAGEELVAFDQAVAQLKRGGPEVETVAETAAESEEDVLDLSSLVVEEGLAMEEQPQGSGDEELDEILSDLEIPEAGQSPAEQAGEPVVEAAAEPVGGEPVAAPAAEPAAAEEPKTAPVLDEEGLEFDLSDIDFSSVSKPGQEAVSEAEPAATQMPVEGLSFDVDEEVGADRVHAAPAGEFEPVGEYELDPDMAVEDLEELLAGGGAGEEPADDEATAAAPDALTKKLDDLLDNLPDDSDEGKK